MDEALFMETKSMTNVTEAQPDALFFFNDTGPTEIYTLSQHDALPISTAATVIAAPISMREVTVSSRSAIALTSAVTSGYAATIGATSATGAAVRARYMRSTAPPLSAPVIPNQTKLRGVARILCERRSRSALTTVIDETA